MNSMGLKRRLLHLTVFQRCAEFGKHKALTSGLIRCLNSTYADEHRTCQGMLANT